MRILAALTYYLPHISGLTIYASRLNRLLADDGYDVTVLTSRFAPTLAKAEVIDGTQVVRSPVLLRLSKGVIMPLFPWYAFRLLRQHRLVFLHLPQIEAALLAIYAKLLRKPVVVLYHCDIVLPSWRARLLFGLAIRISHGITCLLADRIVVNTEEYARDSRLLRRFLYKTSWVYPPIELPELTEGNELRQRFALGEGPLVGFVGRLAEEKGIDALLASLTLVRREFPGVRLVMAGPTDAVPGERRARARLMAKIEEQARHVVHLGILADEDLRAFYGAIDVLSVPSTNSTESFGLTQAEAMLAGTPVVVSDLPGVREASRATGMGEAVPPQQPEALAGALLRVLKDPARYARPVALVREIFDPRKTARFYAALFGELAPVGAGGPTLPAAAADEDRSAVPAKRS